MPQTRPPSHLLQEPVLVGNLEHHVVAQAMEPYDLGP
jgi:hypothetical protein